VLLDSKVVIWERRRHSSEPMRSRPRQQLMPVRHIQQPNGQRLQELDAIHTFDGGARRLIRGTERRSAHEQEQPPCLGYSPLAPALAPPFLQNSLVGARIFYSVTTASAAACTSFNGTPAAWATRLQSSYSGARVSTRPF